jgi:hypothetical protein
MPHDTGGPHGLKATIGIPAIAGPGAGKMLQKEHIEVWSSGAAG